MSALKIPFRGKHVSLVCLIFVLICTYKCEGKYDAGQTVHVTMNKVWPYHNPAETYSYYEALPFCQPQDKQTEPMTFGQIMRGDRHVKSLFNITFQMETNTTVFCKKKMFSNELTTLRNAIDEEYMFEIYVDDLPIYQPVGVRQLKENGFYRYLLITKLAFQLGYNEGRVVSASLVTDTDVIDITYWNEDFTIEFTYSVNWFPSETSVAARLQQQLAGPLTVSSRGLDIHWLAIINSFVLVLLVVSFLLLVILRVVRSDLSRFLRIPDEELAAGVEEEAGWKLLHADVFRAPPHRMWFCACVGSGANLLMVSLVTVMIGSFSPYFKTGELLSAAVFGYFLTTFVSGYISANLYRRLGGVKWAWNIIVTILMFSGPAFLIWSCLNTVAIIYSSTAALPFSTACAIFALFFFVSVPLTVFGGIIGRRHAAKALDGGNPFPCKTNRLAREIPAVYWYQSPWIQSLASGVLPFSAIYIELHYVFISIWGTKVYTLYGILFLACLMLLLVAATISTLLTYFHLNGEDHRWWWRSFFSGGSVAIAFLFHCVYYFVTSTRMYGILQTTFYFGYSLVVAWMAFLTVGFVTFTANYAFVTYIYSRVKSD